MQAAQPPPASSDVRGPTGRATARAALAAVALVAVACAPERNEDVVERLSGSSDRTSPSAGAGAGDPADAPTDSSARTGAAAPTPSPLTPPQQQNTPTTEAVAAVDRVLAEYAELLTALAADPAGAPPPGSPARDRWDSVVLAGSALSTEVLDRLHTRATVERVVVVPGPDGTSYRHIALDVRDVAPGVVEFDWCGWSPGLGRSIDTGEVVDDDVAHATGTGQVVLHEGRWRLSALDQWELTLLAPNSPDPCTPQQAGHGP